MHVLPRILGSDLRSPAAANDVKRCLNLGADAVAGQIHPSFQVVDAAMR